MHSPRRTHSAFAGIHKPTRNSGSHHESFEIFYLDRSRKKPAELAGWYWRPLPTETLPNPEPFGPFTSSRAAYRDARRQS